MTLHIFLLLYKTKKSMHIVNIRGQTFYRVLLERDLE